jgi:hypothetical protein
VSARRTVGFGCPNAPDPHHFVVEIPVGRNGTVMIAEHYGARAYIEAPTEVELRCRLPRYAWSAIAEDLRRHFNERLKEKRLAGGRWTSGPNKVERLLGRELLVLAWSVERAAPELIGNALRNWLALKPEERWWLYAVTAAATGGAEQAELGWRKALRIALTESPIADGGWRTHAPAHHALHEEPSPFGGADAPLLFPELKSSR